MFHAEWVKQGIAASGFRSRLYLTNLDFNAPGRTVLNVPYVPLTQESSDLIMQRFMSDEFVIEDILFVSALKVARRIAELRGRQQIVYMIGFDFNPSLGHSHKLDYNFAPDLGEENSIRISVQEFYFINTLYFLRESPLTVKHVGNRQFSAISVDELNHTVQHRDVLDDEQGRVLVVAELTTNHFGDRTRLERMIRASKAAGANYVKLQKRDLQTIYTPEQLASPYVSPFGKTFADYRNQLELSKDDFEFVDKLCKELDIGWFASILDEPSFRFMQELQPKLVKLPSTISEHTNFLKYVATNYRGGLVLSTGMTDEEYEKFVLDNFSENEHLYLLQCNSAYPTPLHDCNVAVVRHYHEISKRNPRIVPGYSSHDFGWQASALAVAAGARMLEKHVKLGDTEWAHFDAVAVDLATPAFKEYVDRIRETEKIMGSETKKINLSEHHKYVPMQS